MVARATDREALLRALGEPPLTIERAGHLLAAFGLPGTVVEVSTGHRNAARFVEDRAGRRRDLGAWIDHRVTLADGQDLGVQLLVALDVEGVPLRIEATITDAEGCILARDSLTL